MKASETQVQLLIDNIRQYVIPLFQRPYCWESAQWRTLWRDLFELYQEDNPRGHFIGSIVTMPAHSAPEAVTKYVLIDGQQRLTTLLVLLAVVRDQARGHTNHLSDRIEDLLLKNRHQDGNDVYKLLPTQDDREAFFAIMDGRGSGGQSLLKDAYEFFDRRIRLEAGLSLDRLYDIVRNKLSVVSIILDRDDNPHVIFESLNAKGRPLTQADLIRNLFFMRIGADRVQERMYVRHWQPMQQLLEDDLSEFIRHFLMRDGHVVRQSDIYLSMKERIERLRSAEAIGVLLEELSRYAEHYAKLLRPSRELNERLRTLLERLNRFEATTAYPFLLSVYNDYQQKTIGADEFVLILETLESFLVRRFICRVPTSALTRLFPLLYASAQGQTSLVEGVRAFLGGKGFPSDDQFDDDFRTAAIYEGGRSTKAKLILERLESSYRHREPVEFDKLTIEHVMPRTLTDWWRQHLGQDYEAVHDRWLDTIGNLTLTGYNSEMSNSDFPNKRTRLERSHVELNRGITAAANWNEESIIQRAGELAERALAVWPDFASRPRGTDVPVEEELQEDAQLLIARVLASLGGQVSRSGRGTRLFYRTGDGKTVNVKHSKRHSHYYWYGFHDSLWSESKSIGVTHFVFVLANTGFVAVPFAVMEQYLEQAGTSRNRDGTTRHYHVLISTDARPELFHHGKPARFALESHLVKF